MSDRVRLACLGNGMVRIQPLKRYILAAIGLLLLLIALKGTCGLSEFLRRDVSLP